MKTKYFRQKLILKSKNVVNREGFFSFFLSARSGEKSIRTKMKFKAARNTKKSKFDVLLSSGTIKPVLNRPKMKMVTAANKLSEEFSAVPETVQTVTGGNTAFQTGIETVVETVVETTIDENAAESNTVVQEEIKPDIKITEENADTSAELESVADISAAPVEKSRHQKKKEQHKKHKSQLFNKKHNQIAYGSMPLDTAKKPDPAVIVPVVYKQEAPAVTATHQEKEEAITEEPVKTEPEASVIQSEATGNISIIVPESENIFMSSLELLSERDVEPNEALKNKKKKQIDYLKYMMLTVCAAVFLYAGYNIVLKVADYIQADIDNQNIRDIFYDTTESDFTLQKKPASNTPMEDLLSLQKKSVIKIKAEVTERNDQILMDTQKSQTFAEINPDFYGWINIPGTNVDYPVVQTSNNDYYLHYNFNKVKQSSGTIFVDYHNNRDIMKNYNTVLYGHNMKNSTMFRRVLYFSENEKNFQSGIIELTINGAVYRFEVFSTYKTEPTYPYINTEFLNGEQFVEFCKALQARSKYQKTMTFTPDDHIITLSTCTSSPPNYRIAVHAKLIEVISANSEGEMVDILDELVG